MVKYVLLLTKEDYKKSTKELIIQEIMSDFRIENNYCSILYNYFWFSIYNIK